MESCWSLGMPWLDSIHDGLSGELYFIKIGACEKNVGGNLWCLTSCECGLSSWDRKTQHLLPINNYFRSYNILAFIGYGTIWVLVSACLALTIVPMISDILSLQLSNIKWLHKKRVGMSVQMLISSSLLSSISKQSISIISIHESYKAQHINTMTNVDFTSTGDCMRIHECETLLWNNVD